MAIKKSSDVFEGPASPSSETVKFIFFFESDSSESQNIHPRLSPVAKCFPINPITDVKASTYTQHPPESESPVLYDTMFGNRIILSSAFTKLIEAELFVNKADSVSTFSGVVPV